MAEQVRRLANDASTLCGLTAGVTCAAAPQGSARRPFCKLNGQQADHASAAQQQPGGVRFPARHEQLLCITRCWWFIRRAAHPDSRTERGTLAERLANAALACTVQGKAWRGDAPCTLHDLCAEDKRKVAKLIRQVVEAEQRVQALSAQAQEVGSGSAAQFAALNSSASLAAGPLPRGLLCQQLSCGHCSCHVDSDCSNPVWRAWEYLQAEWAAQRGEALSQLCSATQEAATKQRELERLQTCSQKAANEIAECAAAPCRPPVTLCRLKSITVSLCRIRSITVSLCRLKSIVYVLPCTIPSALASLALLCI